MPGISDLITPRKRVTFSVDTTGFVFGTASVQLDASIDETHSAESEITDYPVEEGSNVSDNSRPKPARLTIRGVVTGTPMDITAIALPPSVKASRGTDAWEKLNQWRFQGKRLRVTTTLKTYRAMVIQSISVNRNAKNSDGVEMDISMQEVFTVSAQTAVKRAEKEPQKNKAEQSTSEANPAEKGTVLKSLVGFFSGGG